MEVVAKLLRDQCKHRDGVVIKLHDKRAALENLGKHLGLFKENTALNVNISLADLVNGSYKIEKGEIAPPVIEAKALPANGTDSEHSDRASDSPRR